LGLRETDAFSGVVVQDFEGVAVENTDDYSMKGLSKTREGA